MYVAFLGLSTHIRSTQCTLQAAIFHRRRLRTKAFVCVHFRSCKGLTDKLLPDKRRSGAFGERQQWYRPSNITTTGTKIDLLKQWPGRTTTTYETGNPSEGMWMAIFGHGLMGRNLTKLRPGPPGAPQAPSISSSYRRLCHTKLCAMWNKRWGGRTSTLAANHRGSTRPTSGNYGEWFKLCGTLDAGRGPWMSSTSCRTSRITRHCWEDCLTI